MAQKNNTWQTFQFCQQIKEVEIGQSLIITEEAKQILSDLVDMWLSRQLGGQAKVKKGFAVSGKGGRKPDPNPSKTTLAKRKSREKLGKLAEPSQD